MKILNRVFSKLSYLHLFDIFLFLNNNILFFKATAITLSSKNEPKFKIYKNY